MRKNSISEDSILHLFKKEMLRCARIREEMLLSGEQIRSLLESRFYLKGTIIPYIDACVEKGYLQIVQPSLFSQNKELYRITVIGLLKIDENLVY